MLWKQLASVMAMFDFVSGVTAGSIGGGFIANYFKGAPVTIVSLLVLGLLVVVTGKAGMISLKVRRILTGEPMVVIRIGKILEGIMKKARYNVDNLLVDLRQNNVFDLGMVEFAVLEPDGHSPFRRKASSSPSPRPARVFPPYTVQGIPCKEVFPFHLFPGRGLPGSFVDTVSRRMLK